MGLFFTGSTFVLKVYFPGSGQYETFEKQNDPFPWLMVGVTALPFVIACSYLLYKYFQNRKWMKGSFPFDLDASTENLLEAYMSITAHFILLDRYRQMEKIAYLKSYFVHHFHQTPVDIHDSIQRNFHYPIQLESSVNWIGHNFSIDSKKKLVQFLVGLCHVDLHLRQKEYEALKQVTAILELELSFLDGAIHLYREQKKGPKKALAVPDRLSERKRYASILGVDEHAGKKEIKHRFRELAKKHHPDRYSKDSPEQQQMAHERFLEIQQAYEYLTG